MAARSALLKTLSGGDDTSRARNVEPAAATNRHVVTLIPLNVFDNSPGQRRGMQYELVG